MVEDERIARKLTGMVAGGLGVEPDYDRGAVGCDRCDRELLAGDRAVVAVRNYEGHTWEPVAVFCADHGVERVTDVTEIRADDQAVLAATLEPTGYRDPLGEHHPRSLTLGGISVLDTSPAAEGF